MLICPLSFTKPNVLRASNDARYPMACSIASMMLLRLARGYALAAVFHLGAIGIWIAMVADWLGRGGRFTARFVSGKWLAFAPGFTMGAQGEKR